MEISQSPLPQQPEEPGDSRLENGPDPVARYEHLEETSGRGVGPHAATADAGPAQVTPPADFTPRGHSWTVYREGGYGREEHSNDATAARPVVDAASAGSGMKAALRDTNDADGDGVSAQPAAVVPDSDFGVIRALMTGEDPDRADRVLADAAARVADEEAQQQPVTAAAPEAVEAEVVAADITTVEIDDIHGWYNRLKARFQAQYAGDLRNPETAEQVNSEINTEVRQVVAVLGDEAGLAHAVVAGVGIGALRGIQEHPGRAGIGVPLQIIEESGVLTDAETKKLQEIAGVINQAKSQMVPGNKTNSLKAIAETLDTELKELADDEHQSLRAVLLACGAGIMLEDTYNLSGLSYRAQLEHALHASVV